jgi:hypothetical protein
MATGIWKRWGCIDVKLMYSGYNERQELVADVSDSGHLPIEPPAGDSENQTTWCLLLRKCDGNIGARVMHCRFNSETRSFCATKKLYKLGDREVEIFECYIDVFGRSNDTL